MSNHARFQMVRQTGKKGTAFPTYSHLVLDVSVPCVPLREHDPTWDSQ